MKTGKLLITTVLLVGIFASQCIGSSDKSISYYLWGLINEVRANPETALQIPGVDRQAAEEALGEKSWILSPDASLQPAAWNENLYSAAEGHNRDMIENLYYSYTSLDGRTSADRVAGSGYEAEFVKESLGILSFRLYKEPEKAARMILESLVRDELDPEVNSSVNILNPDVSEAGISFSSSVISINEMENINAYLVVVDFAAPVDPKPYFVGRLCRKNETNEPETGISYLFLKNTCTGNTVYVEKTPHNLFQVEKEPEKCLSYTFEYRKSPFALSKEPVIQISVTSTESIENQYVGCLFVD